MAVWPATRRAGRRARRRPVRTRALAGAAALLVAAGGAGCGGEGDDGAARELLKRAFAKPIGSARVSVDVTVEVEGIEELKDPVKLSLTGPYRAAEGDRLPSFDWDVSLSGGGQSLSVGLLSTTENFFVNFQGTDYEAGEEQIRAVNRQLVDASRQRGDSSLRRFGVDPASWLSEPRDEGEEEVAGVKTTHLTAKVDVGRMLDDLNRLVERAGGSVAGAPPPQKLTEAQQRQIEQVVGEPRFDVYVGEDDAIRRLSTDVEIDVPELARARANGLEGANVSFSIEFAGVGEPVRIEAPREARPLAELSSQLGGLGALSGGLGPQNGSPPPTDGGAPPEGGGGSPEGQQFERYSRCLEEADPAEIEQIERCTELLR